MEPPAKRLRILKSVDVDQSNPEYIRKKREAEAQLRSQFESIFAKYESMPESMSDEIDMVTGTVVVDRGHLRGLAGNPNALRAADFLEDLLGDDTAPNRVIDGYGDDDIDELAPPEPPKQRTRKADEGDATQGINQGALLLPTASDNALSGGPTQPASNFSPTNFMNLAQAPQTPANFMQLAHLPPTPASLTQLAQLAPTPENQLVQNSFLAAFSQTMVQAVHQAFSIANLMGSSSTVTNPTTPFIPSTIPSTTVDRVSAATNPKWYFPPLPEKQCPPLNTQSSPIPTSDTARKRRSSLTGDKRKGPTKRKVSQAHAPQSFIRSSDSQTKPKQRRVQTYHFSSDDDQYIIHHRETHNLSWPEIKQSQEKWQNWPISAIYNHWYKNLRDQSRGLKSSLLVEVDGNSNIAEEKEQQELDELGVATEEDGAQRELEVQVQKNTSSPSQQRQLLTPYSLQHSGSSDTHKDANDMDVATARSTIYPIEYDEEEMEELSIVDPADIEEAVPMDDPMPSSPPPDEHILPSIEIEMLMGDDEVSGRVVDKPPFVEEQVRTSRRHAVVVAKSTTLVDKPVSTSLSSFPRPKPKPRENPSFQLDSESDDDNFDPIMAGSSPLALSSKKPLSCKFCRKPFKFAKALKAHELTHPSITPKTKHPSMAPPQPKPGPHVEANLSEPDELDSSPVVQIKREPSTPRATLFSSMLFKTPKSAPQPTSKSTPSFTRKDYLKVQQSWTKKGRKASPGPKQAQALRSRASFQGRVGKRGWEAESEEDSEDELAGV
ncbi:hypothetical protein K505DRAFT_372336 [Melanomma pulvis-pyrius CBS 109.77]|uniref:C2H2-type domain-containing protein n=1 Tax=Melanomma pulvis-pyrius CBS 109.77 TaxID=1314802 RepID=A0A6A6XN25_9PLEO|nr:hypothetical protein K505DRAFT_372336 [Melanomma pulvis-pyrius CBS 109.77]